ncbi:MAG TPA: 5'/3'-nucleotidase SurE, partial [Acidimicrobiaceae bacterium]|nr:5'/3'-nucleotidase SurE [Acidimicrobiaceae bacterium]
MRILVTNDDGISSPGLHALVVAVAEAGYEPVVAAP